MFYTKIQLNMTSGSREKVDFMILVVYLFLATVAILYSRPA